MSALVHDLLPYVPASLINGIAEGDGASGRRFEGALLFADVTGFTPLTERLAARGPRGAEALAEILNVYFGTVIEEIAAHGGEVAKFAGDATIAAWRAEEATGDITVLRAVRCALEIQEALARLETVQNEQLRMRIGVATGALWTGIVGGEGGRREFLLGGAPVGEAAAAAAGAQPGTVAVSAAAWPLIEDRCAGGTAQARGVGVHAVHEALLRRPATKVQALSEDRLRTFVPRAIVSRLEAGHLQWLAEFRRVSVAFVNIGGVDYEGAGAGVAADAATRALQQVVYRYEGSVNQLVVDDKGTTLVAAWGLPSFNHEDDAARAVEAAVGMCDALTELGLRGAVGVATGLAFTGHRGNARRREYAMIGDVMNLAARLMMAAGVGVLCDEATAHAANRRSFEVTAPMRLKGKAAAVRTHRPGALRRVTPRSTTMVVGRAAEQAVLQQALEDLSRRRQGGVMVLTGDAGMGKSRLLSHLVEEARALGVRCLSGEADAIEKATPYFVWRTAMAELMGGGGRGDPNALRRAVGAALSDDPTLAKWAPLLNALLPLDLPENEVTAQMESQGRADRLRDLTVHLLRRAADRQATLLVLDDAHWFDSASWGLLSAVVQRVPPLLVAVATRPAGEPTSPNYQQLLRVAGPRRLTLSAMPVEDALALVARRLGVKELPAAVGRFIAQRAEGNPFFSEQLGLAMRETGHLEIDGEQCRLASGLTDLGALQVPHTVQGVITGRIDRLSPTEQLTLKVASVIGRNFGFRILGAVHPVEADRATLPQQLGELERLDLTVLDSPEPDLTYLFKHVITQEVAYNVLAFAQRRDLHRAVAEWYERTHAADRAPYLPLLAHHWTRAEVESRAIDCLEEAAEQALASHANEEAIQFFREAQAMAGSDADVARRRSRWEWGIGVALIKLSRYSDAHRHLVESLRLLGRPAPRTRFGLALSTIGQMTLQAIHRSLPGALGRLSGTARSEVLQAADIQQRLTEVAYWNNDFGALVHAILSCVNLADRGGASKELITAFGTMGFLSGLAGLHRTAAAYRARARAVGYEVGHQDSIAYASELEAVYFGAMGKWQEAYEAADRGSEMFEQLGDSMRWHTCFSLRGYFHLHQGHFELARPIFEEGLRIAGPGGAVQAKLWSAAALLATQLAQGDVEDDTVATLEELLEQRVHHSDAILAHGLLAQVKHRRGDSGSALAHAAAATPLIDVFPPASWHTFIGTAAVAELYLLLAEDADGGARDRMRCARHSITGLARFARMNPPAWARANLYRGRYLWLRRRRRAAGRAWARALALAEAIDMPYEAGLVHLELGRRRSPSCGGEHLAQAASIFRRLGARHDLERVEKLRGSDPEDPTEVDQKVGL